MSEKISNIILEIETRFKLIKVNLENELAKNVELTLENKKIEEKVVDLVTQISSLQQKNQILIEENIALKEEKMSLIHNANSTNNVDKNKDVEIDFLVKEIDQCINQIKNNL